MRCKLCSSEKTSVQDSRTDRHERARRIVAPRIQHLNLEEKIHWRYRYRHCKQCNHRFHTIEIDISEIKRITNGNTNQKG